MLLTCVDSGRCAVVDSFIAQRPREKGLARTIWIKGLTVLEANKEGTEAVEDASTHTGYVGK